MKRLSKKETMNKSPLKKFFRIMLVLIVLCAIGIIALLFTNYKGYGDKIKLLVIPEPTVVADSIRGDIDSELPSKAVKDSSIFKFNTHYDKIEPDSAMLSDSLALEDENSENQVSDQFGGTEDVDSTVLLEADSLINVVEENTPSVSGKDLSEPVAISNSKTTDLDATSRIIAISAKNLLLNKNRDDQEAIIIILSESSTINSISILDPSNTVVFSTDQKNLGKSAVAFLGKDPNNDKLKCIDNDLTCILPIYHTFGKLGYAIVRKAR